MRILRNFRPYKPSPINPCLFSDSAKPSHKTSDGSETDTFRFIDKGDELIGYAVAPMMTFLDDD